MSRINIKTLKIDNYLFWFDNYNNSERLIELHYKQWHATYYCLS